MKPEHYLTLWKYYEFVERRYAKTEQYVAHREINENTISIEFAQQIMIICSEVEVVFKALCKALGNEHAGSIGDYKECILENYPQIPQLEVKAPTISCTPWEDWKQKNKRLGWWGVYALLKHDRQANFMKANWITTHQAMAGYYSILMVLRNHLDDLTNVQKDYLRFDCKSSYFYGIRL
ncbi:MAG: hypothetical protein VB115_16610 [Christensenellaceae bacterium]|nr:hypothetical protein [Christensenellaceae bacterium]